MKVNLTENLRKLQVIIDWFDRQEEVDVEKALEKVKEGAVLIRQSKERLHEVENEFEEVKKEIGDTDTDQEDTPF